jgi:predicted RNA-binding protein with PIN domain
MRHFIIDAYNVLFYFNADPSPLRKDREKIINQVAEHCEALNIRATLVFDGSDEHTADYGSKAIVSCIEVVYSPKKTNADDCILELVEAAKNPKIITVITSDQGLARRCKAHFTSHMNVDDFFALKSKSSRARKSDKPSEESSSEVDRLLHIFEERLYGKD